MSQPAAKPRRARRDGSPEQDIELAALRFELTELRALVERLLAGDDPDPDDPLLSVQEIAALTGRGDEAVRTWFAGRGLGYYDRVARRHRARRSELVAFLIKEFGAGRLPYALRNLGQPKLCSGKVPPHE